MRQYPTYLFHGFNICMSPHVAFGGLLHCFHPVAFRDIGLFFLPAADFGVLNEFFSVVFRDIGVLFFASRRLRGFPSLFLSCRVQGYWRGNFASRRLRGFTSLFSSCRVQRHWVVFFLPAADFGVLNDFCFCRVQGYWRVYFASRRLRGFRSLL
jgi:hypothetical protein